MKLFLVAVLTVNFIFAVQIDKIFIDSNYLFEGYSVEKVKTFIRFFPKNRMTDDQIEYAYYLCEKKGLSIECLVARMQTEQGVIVNLKDFDNARRLNWCMSYGIFMSLKWATYESQVSNGINLMMDNFNVFKNGMSVEIEFDSHKMQVKPLNASTYAIHKYNPVWNFALNHGEINQGNKLFLQVYKDFKPYWNKIN